MNSEHWVTIRDFPNYQVSNLGNIRQALSGKPMKCNSIRGYKQVRLSSGGKGRTHLVHRLVAAAFLPNPSNLPMVNHLDSDRANNSVQNLEWCDQARNMVHAAEAGRVTGTRVAPEDVRAIRQRIESGHEVWQVARDFGLAESLVYRIGNRLTRRWVGN